MFSVLVKESGKKERKLDLPDDAIVQAYRAWGDGRGGPLFPVVLPDGTEYTVDFEKVQGMQQCPYFE